MDFNFDVLLKAVDLVLILAIMGVTEGVKRALPEAEWRWIPVIPMVLGVLCGAVVSPAGSGWRVMAKAALLYAGAASLGYEFLRTTIFKTGGKADEKIKLPG